MDPSKSQRGMSLPGFWLDQKPWRLTKRYILQFIALLYRKYHVISCTGYKYGIHIHGVYIYIYRPFNSYHYYRKICTLKKNVKTLLGTQRAPWELCQASMGLFFRRITTFAFEGKFWTKGWHALGIFGLVFAVRFSRIHISYISLSFPWCKYRTHMKITCDYSCWEGKANNHAQINNEIMIDDSGDWNTSKNTIWIPQIWGHSGIWVHHKNL